MNERDMRVIKTKESIEKALFELLAVKPLDKVTVVELPRRRSSHRASDPHDPGGPRPSRQAPEREVRGL